MAESIFEEIMCENLPVLKEDMNISIQKLSELLVGLSSKRPTPGHIIIKLSKDKRVLKAQDTSDPSHKGILNKITRLLARKFRNNSGQWADTAK